jgi:hypothetical protein
MNITFRIRSSPLFSFSYCCAGWVYHVSFTKVLTIYQIYHSLIHIQFETKIPSFTITTLLQSTMISFLDSSLHWNQGDQKKKNIYTYICLYLYIYKYILYIFFIFICLDIFTYTKFTYCLVPLNIYLVYHVLQST